MTLVYCAHCRQQRPEDEFQRISPEKVLDEQGRQVVYAKHTCGGKTLKRVAQPAGRTGIIRAA